MHKHYVLLIITSYGLKLMGLIENVLKGALNSESISPFKAQPYGDYWGRSSVEAKRDLMDFRR